MFRENLTGGMSMSVFGITTSSCVILYSMTRRASFLQSARVRQFRCSIIHITNARGVMVAVSNIPSSPTLYLF
jgi:hypothetical protein